jgi:nucleoside-diphosphate-sugar epimerase
MRILVTGNAGFLAHHLIWGFSSGHEMHGIDRWTGDLHNPEVIRREIASFEPDMVIHLAAKVGRLFGEDDPLQTIRDNTLITADVALACRDAGIRLAYASTSEVYGDHGEEGCPEDQPFDMIPYNVYGLSKRWGEEVSSLYLDDPVFFRFSMPYGPGLPAGRGRAALINMLHQALHRQPIVVHKGAERSWCFVEDTIRGARMIVESGLGGGWNIGRDDQAVSMLEVARMACDLTGASQDLIEVVDAPSNQTVVKRLPTKKLRSLGWKPQVDLEEGMERTLEWVKSLEVDGSVKEEKDASTV